MALPAVSLLHQLVDHELLPLFDKRMVCSMHLHDVVCFYRVGGQQTIMEQILEETVRNILTEFEMDDRALISTSGSRTSPLEY